MNEVFHPGEVRVQEQTGSRQMSLNVGRMINPSLLPQAVGFLEAQNMLILSSSNAEGLVWSSVLFGETGFIEVPDLNRIIIHLDQLQHELDDVLFQNLKEFEGIGSMFIDMARQRRYRVNGTAWIVGNKLEISVQQAYGNCPKFIQKRARAGEYVMEKVAPRQTEGKTLNARQLDLISKADTFFVGSRNQAGHMDISHRGGNPGFIQILPDQTLKVPDYQGNNLFNTLGNFADDPHAGLLFIDFESGNVLQLTGKAELLFDQTSDDDLNRTTGTGRYWLFQTENWIETHHQHHADWELFGRSMFNPEIPE
ncbi:MAG: pyridoxamine 5'-phosphate oxidase family protein [Bacteroidota bacterium]